MTGVSYVRTQWRQFNFSPGAQTDDRSGEAHPRTAGSGSNGAPALGNHWPPAAKVGVGVNTPVLALPLSAPIPDVLKKKRVLLVDTSHAKRDLRAEVLRKLGMYVDIAVDIAEARSWWRPALYNLVLIHMEKGRGQRDKFCDDLRGATPPQRLAFLVGQPEYLVDSPNADQEMLMEQVEERVIADKLKGMPLASLDDSTQRWGILEASRRISAVRSASVARSNAMRALPPPLRDSEGRRPKPAPTSLDDLLREEMR